MSLRVFLGAFGQPGHAFPMLALGSALVARGHEVSFETWSRWREHVEAEGMRFLAAPEYPVVPSQERPLQPYEAAVRATEHTREALAAIRPHVLVHDILTLGPALAGELEGVPVATLIPHVHPAGAPGFPPYSFGARLPRTAAGRVLWTALAPVVEAGLRRGRAELNGARTRLGLAPVARLHGGLSERLCMVGTFPQLEYPRGDTQGAGWPPGTAIVGPLMWEMPFGDVAAPRGEQPLVVVAPSTAQDPEQRLLETALRGLARAPVRVLATTNRKPLPRPVEIGSNTRLVEWISYARTMPQASLVICHGGHGTMVRALAAGCPVLVVPHSGDMAENAARADWAGVGVRLPWSLLTPLTLRLAVMRALGDRERRRRARELSGWASRNDAAGRAAQLVERCAQEPSDAAGSPQSAEASARTNSISSGASPSARSTGSP